MKQIVSLSGGKDSTCMLLMMLERGEQIDDIVFFDWGMEFPEMYEHLEKLEDYIGRGITRLYPEHSWEYYCLEVPRRDGSKGWGIPLGRVQWCSRIKAETIKRAYPNTTMCIGYSYEERFRRARYDGKWTKKYNIINRYPLLELGVAERVARDYCYSKGFDWGGYYKLNPRMSCWCCPFKRKNEYIVIREHYLDLWQKLLEITNRSPYSHPQRKIIEKLSGVCER